MSCMSRLDQTLAALADPSRRKLLLRLAEKPCGGGALAEGCTISRPAICKHTRLLTRARLIKARERGRERIYELAPKGNEIIEEVILQLEQVGRLWDIALNAFKSYA